MTARWLRYILFFALITAPTLAFAQIDEEVEAARAAAEQAQRDAEAQAQAQAMQAAIDRGQAALQEFVNSTELPGGQLNPQADLAAKFRQFREAIPKFREAVSLYRSNLSTDAKLDKPRREIQSETNIMLRYLSAAKVKHPPADPLEFKGSSPTELEREVLNSAERVASYFQLAVRTERQTTVSVKTLDLLFRLDGELLRLKWLTSHAK